MVASFFPWLGSPSFGHTKDAESIPCIPYPALPHLSLNFPHPYAFCTKHSDVCSPLHAPNSRCDLCFLPVNLRGLFLGAIGRQRVHLQSASPLTGHLHQGSSCISIPGRWSMHLLIPFLLLGRALQEMLQACANVVILCRFQAVERAAPLQKLRSSLYQLRINRHGSYIRPYVLAIVPALQRTPRPSQRWQYYPQY